MIKINKQIVLFLLIILFLTGCTFYTSDKEVGVYNKIQEGQKITMTDASAQELTNKLLYPMTQESGHIELEDENSLYVTATLNFYASKIKSLEEKNKPVSDELNTKYVLLKEYAYNSGVMAVVASGASIPTNLVPDYLESANKGSKDLEFSVDKVNSGTVLRVTQFRASSVDVIIPDDINGVPIVSIEESAFADKNIKSIVVGKNVKEIKTKAFTGNNFTSIELPEGTKVEPDSFDAGVTIK